MANYGNYFSDGNFWDKVKKYAKVAGKSVLKPAFELYHVIRADETPLWAKGVAVGALGYFILPIDAIPDIMVGLGYTDDLGVMAGALQTLGKFVTPEIRKKAEDDIDDLLG